MTTTDVLGDRSTLVDRAARAGYAARGAVFLVIGYFAAKAAYSTGETLSSKDVVTTVFGSFGGVVLLVVLVAALAGFALWRLIQAGLDVDRHGTGAKGLVVRAGLLASAVSYGALAVFAALLAAGVTTGGDGVLGKAVTAAYEAGYGRILTLAAAAVMAGVGAAHIVKGFKAGFEKYMRFPAGRRWLKPVCQAGLMARGATFVLLAALLFTGAASYADGETPGLETALDAMASWRFGWAFLAATGLGLFAFGLYGLAQALYRRIDVGTAL